MNNSYYYYKYDNKKLLSIKIKNINEEYYLFEVSAILSEIYKIGNYANIISESINDKSILSNNLSSIYLEYSKKTIKIEKIKNGSIEIFLSGLSLLSSIIIPIVIHLVENQKSEKITMHFDINSKDKEISSIIKNIELRYYGNRRDIEKVIFKIFEEHGYSTEMIQPYCYKISKVIESSVSRIVKIIRI